MGGLPPPTAPTVLTATRNLSNVSLAWTDNSSNETGFYIERRVSVTGSFGVIATGSMNVTSYIDATAASGTSYDYQVRAYNPDH